MSDYHVRQRKRIAGLAAKQEGMRQDKALRASQIIDRYQDAHTGYYGTEPPAVEYIVHTGWYKVTQNNGGQRSMREEALISAATGLYAMAHEREITP